MFFVIVTYSVVLVVNHAHDVASRWIMCQRSLEFNQGKGKHEPETIIHIVCVPSLAVKPLRQVRQGFHVITYGDGPRRADGGQPRAGVHVETYFGVGNLLHLVHEFDIASLLTGEPESEFVDVGEASTESDEVSLFAEGHVHLRRWIAGGTVEVGMASDCAGGVGKKVAIDDGGLGVGDGAEISEELCREDVYVTGGDTSKDGFPGPVQERTGRHELDSLL